METRSGAAAGREAPRAPPDHRAASVGRIGRGTESGRVVLVAERISKSFAGVTALDLLAALPDLALSTGSACSSGKVGPSQALKAMQVAPQIAHGAVRASLGWNSTEADVDRFLEVWARVHAALTERRATKAA